MRQASTALPGTVSSPTRHPSASLAARLADRLADSPTGEGVYLLAFYRNGAHVAYGGASPRGRALHYCGWASNIRARLAAHLAGEGSRLCRAVARAGYEIRLVRVWHGRGRDYERALKARHNLAPVCPVCLYALADRGEGGPSSASSGLDGAPGADRGPALWME